MCCVDALFIDCRWISQANEIVLQKRGEVMVSNFFWQNSKNIERFLVHRFLLCNLHSFLFFCFSLQWSKYKCLIGWLYIYENVNHLWNNNCQLLHIALHHIGNDLNRSEIKRFRYTNKHRKWRGLVKDRSFDTLEMWNKRNSFKFSIVRFQFLIYRQCGIRSNIERDTSVQYKYAYVKLHICSDETAKFAHIRNHKKRNEKWFS